MSRSRNGKIVLDREALLERIETLKREGKRVVFANGCFDLFHVGHIRYLEGASREGDVMLVALNSDESARALKGPERPVMPLVERMEMVAAVECVDMVTKFEGTDCADLLKMLKPDVHAKGTDWSAETIPERDIVRGYGGRIAIVGDPKDHSSSGLLEEIKKRGLKPN
ncbi:MAG: adenylyltransferase/cytidyltransferase family protein [Phycisphaerae bacterium]|nr:adenylyltransferase/cytidyltransferase family protein [Phycisphaerae bacterium]